MRNLIYLQSFYEEVQKSFSFDESAISGLSDEEIAFVKKSQNVGFELPKSYLEFLKHFGKSCGFDPEFNAWEYYVYSYFDLRELDDDPAVYEYHEARPLRKASEKFSDFIQGLIAENNFYRETALLRDAREM